MNFRSDLADIIKRHLDEHDICYEKNLDVSSLAARYFEMCNRMVARIPRTVHFSSKIHDTLGSLRRAADTAQQEAAADAWGAVFLIRHLFEAGENVNRFLSARIDSATGKRSRDGLLWDFGMHHFHLSKEVEQSGFIKRADYLLFAIVAQKDAYFVDVRPHPRPGDLGWVRQDLLYIVQSNWPQLVKANVLPGVQGTRTVLTDEEKQELRRKNVNYIAQIGDNAIAPLGGGTMADGSSALCMMWALKLLDEIKWHQRVFDAQHEEFRSELSAQEKEQADRMEFKLVLAASLNLSPEDITSLTADECLSRNLYRMGFAVVETTTASPIIIFR